LPCPDSLDSFECRSQLTLLVRLDGDELGGRLLDVRT